MARAAKREIKMHIGLIGGIGPAATDFYYRRLITTFARNNAALDLTIAHADTPTLLGNLARNDVAAQVTIYLKLAERLASAGAGCVAVTSIAGHFCIETFKDVSPLPVIDLISEVSRTLEERSIQRIGLLGTRTVMESLFYGALRQVVVVPPEGQSLEDVHNAYVAMAVSGAVTEGQRRVFIAASERLLSERCVQAILLGGTDLALVFGSDDTSVPVIDCAAIHADAIARAAMA
jgi:aspartate racemase